MGGKGIRRREKNYMAAHGGANTRLPPPPNHSSIDALPSKLRKLMSLAGTGKQQLSRGKKNTDDGADKGTRTGEGTDSLKRKRNDQTLIPQHKEHGDEASEISKNEKKKKKRKGNRADDLRFETLDKEAGANSRRKERRKQLSEARKKKHNKPRTEEDMDFPGREEIKFGDVVQAPPKIVTVPKAFKGAQQDASHERLRLQAVDAYRKRKAWESRPGVKLPPPVTASPSQ